MLLPIVTVLFIAMSGLAGPSLIEAAPESASDQTILVGERLTYEISWLNILAGTAVMEVADGGSQNEQRQAKFVTTAQSRPAITKFFPVDNRVESEFDVGTLLPQHMVFHRHEGKKKEDIEYTFHHKEGTVTAIKGGSSETLPIQPNTQDLISCLYYVRSVMPMKRGTSMTLNIHHDKKNRSVEVRVEDIESVEGVWGKIDAARVLVIMPFQGLFLNQGNIRVWFTTDERKIPLRMKAKVVIGSIVADLVGGYPLLKGAP